MYIFCCYISVISVRLCVLLFNFGLDNKHSLMDIFNVFCFQGPIIGFTFGIVVKNPVLWKLGVTNELIGLSICLTFGETGILVQILIYSQIC